MKMRIVVRLMSSFSFSAKGVLLYTPPLILSTKGLVAPDLQSWAEGDIPEDAPDGEHYET